MVAFVDPKSTVLGNVTYPLLASSVSRFLIFKLFRSVLGVRKLKLNAILWSKSFRRIRLFQQKSLRYSRIREVRFLRKKKARKFGITFRKKRAKTPRILNFDKTRGKRTVRLGTAKKRG